MADKKKKPATSQTIGISNSLLLAASRCCVDWLNVRKLPVTGNLELVLRSNTAAPWAACKTAAIRLKRRNLDIVIVLMLKTIPPIGPRRQSA